MRPPSPTAPSARAARARAPARRARRDRGGCRARGAAPCGARGAWASRRGGARPRGIPRDRNRFRRSAQCARPAPCPRCRAASTRERGRSRRRAPGSCGCQPAPHACARASLRAETRLFECRFAERGQRVEAPAGTILARRNLGILPAAAEDAHFLEPSERAIQRAVGGQQSGVGGVAERLRDFVTVKFVAAAAAQGGRGVADGKLEGNEGPGFSAHGGDNRQIYAFVKRLQSPFRAARPVVTQPAAARFPARSGNHVQAFHLLPQASWSATSTSVRITTCAWNSSPSPLMALIVSPSSIPPRRWSNTSTLRSPR